VEPRLQFPTTLSLPPVRESGSVLLKKYESEFEITEERKTKEKEK
jgi:hypothetical protein